MEDKKLIVYLPGFRLEIYIDLLLVWKEHSSLPKEREETNMVSEKEWHQQVVVKFSQPGDQREEKW